MIELKDGRTLRANRMKAETQARVKKFFEDNPCSSIARAINVLGLSYKTVRRYLDNILKEEKQEIK